MKLTFNARMAPRVQHRAVHWGARRCSHARRQLVKRIFARASVTNHGRAREPGVWKSRLRASGHRVHGGIHGQPQAQVSGRSPPGDPPERIRVRVHFFCLFAAATCCSFWLQSEFTLNRRAWTEQVTQYVVWRAAPECRDNKPSVFYASFQTSYFPSE